MDDNTANKNLHKFVLVAGSCYELPFDVSLNQLHRELQIDAQQYALPEPSNNGGRTGKFSRNLIRHAIKGLAESDNGLIGQSIYDGIFCRRSDHPLPDLDSIDTHPVVIEWEIVDFIKAVARARDYFGKKQISSEDLAEKALDFLVQAKGASHNPALIFLE